MWIHKCGDVVIESRGRVAGQPRSAGHHEISIEDAQNLLTASLQAIGYNVDDAATITSHLIDSELHGYLVALKAIRLANEKAKDVGIAVTNRRQQHLVRRNALVL
jgi:LDH2 family malate/lactate/ureidoglycolate dehydrogenase